MEITKSALEELYRANTNRTVCEQLGISELTLIRYLKDNGIALKGKGAMSKGTKVKIIDDEKQGETL